MKFDGWSEEEKEWFKKELSFRACFKAEPGFKNKATFVLDEIRWHLWTGRVWGHPLQRYRSNRKMKWASNVHIGQVIDTCIGYQKVASLDGFDFIDTNGNRHDLLHCCTRGDSVTFESLGYQFSGLEPDYDYQQYAWHLYKDGYIKADGLTKDRATAEKLAWEWINKHDA